MGYFKLTPGWLDCPKCGGWQILDKTKRKLNGWPIGAVVVENCDHCNGKGEVKDPNYIEKPNPWATIKPKAEPAPVPVHGLPIWDIDDPAPPSEAGPWASIAPAPEEPKGWAIHNE